ncbi:MAG: glycosyltransferase family 2 protein [Sulfolobales archaeon]|mgnify:CR=1 FL=1
MIESIAVISMVASIFIQALHVFYAAGYGRYARKIFSNSTNTLSISDPYISIAIPIKNEDPEILERTLMACALIEWDKKKLEVLVISDDPESARPGIQRVVDRVSSLTGLDVRVIYRDSPIDGRIGALNLASKVARGDAILFLDVDTKPSPGLVRRAVELINSGCDAVVFRWKGYYYYNTRLAKALSTAMEFIVGSLYRGRAGHGFRIIPLGSGTMYRKEVIARAGYWDNNIIQDDYWMGIKLSRVGANVCYCDDEYVEVLVTSTYRAFKIQQMRWSFGAVQAVRRGLAHIVRSSISFAQKVELALYGLQYTPTIAIAFSIYSYPILLTLHSGRDPLLGVLLIFLLWIAVSMAYIAVYIAMISKRQGLSVIEALKRLGASSAVTASLAPHIAINQLGALVIDRYLYPITPKGARELTTSGITRSEAPEILAILVLLLGVAISILRGYVLSLLWLSILLLPFIYTVALIIYNNTIYDRKPQKL